VERPSRRFNRSRCHGSCKPCFRMRQAQAHERQKRQTYLQKRAVVLEPEERKAIAILQQMRALRKDQVARRREKQSERKVAHRKRWKRRRHKRRQG